MDDSKPERDLSWEEVHSALVPLMRPDNRTNILYLAAEYAGVILTLTGCMFTWRSWIDGHLALWQFLCLSSLGIFLVASFQHRLSGLAHDASHFVLFRNRLANELASDLLLLFPLVAMTQKYRSAHLGHHQYVNNPERDPDLIRLNQPSPIHFPMSKASFWTRFVLAPLWPPTLLAYLFGRARAANVGDEERLLRNVYRTKVARCMRGAYWLSLLSIIQISGSWAVFWLFWIVPLITVYPFLMQLREIAHHANTPDDGDLTNSRVFKVNPLVNFCIFPYGQSFHLTHHLFAMVPHHRLPLAHHWLQRYRPYREGVQVCEGYFFRRPGSQRPSLLDVLSAPTPLNGVQRPEASTPHSRKKAARRV